MKKFYIFVLLAMLCAACSKDIVDNQHNFQYIVDNAPESLVVSFEGDDTRIQLNEDVKTVWTSGDQVSVFYRSNANQKWQYTGETGKRVGVLRRLDEGNAMHEIDCVVLLYPYNESYYINPSTYNVQASLPAIQTYLKDSYGLNGNIMISKSEYNQFSLKSVCGWLKVQLQGEGQIVKKISLRGNSGEQVAGQIYINSSDASITLANEMGKVDDLENGTGGNLVFDDTILTEVSLNCGEGVTLSASTTNFYIGLPPQTFKKGLTLTVYYSDGTTMKKSTSNSIEIARNTIKPMSTLYYDGNVPPIYELTYTTNDGRQLDPYTTDGFGANFVENVYDTATGQGALRFDGRITTIPEKAFVACSNLTGITLTDDIKYIRSEAFNGCSKLAIMDIPNSVTTIEDMAFFNCSGMQEITIPSSVTSIGTSSFEGCAGKATINCKIGYTSYYGNFEGAKFTNVIIGDRVTSIGNYAFSGCKSLRSITIPDSVTSIGKRAFSDCSLLNSITIPDSVTSIGEDAFFCCFNLLSVTIPDTIISIGDNAFQYGAPTKVYFQGDLSSWCNIDFTFTSNPLHEGAKLYINGDELTNLVIPSDITDIKPCAFNGCTSITNVTMHNRVTSIGKRAFYKCSNLTSITIENRVATIGEFSFYDCLNLKEVYCKPATPPTGWYGMFFNSDDTPIGCKIYVPRESVEVYKTTAYWTNYVDYLEGYDF